MGDFFFSFLMHLDFIVGRVPTNGWAAAGKRQASASHSLPPFPSAPRLFIFPSSPPTPRAHTHELKPPDRKYRLGSQRGFLIQTSPVEQPEVAAPTPLSPSSFYSSRSLFFGSKGLSQLPPHVLTTRVRVRTHTHTHLNDSTQMYSHHLVVQS